MKVIPFQIPKKPNENIVFQIDSAAQFFGKLHRHREIQLSFIASGKGQLFVGNTITTFESGDFVAIGSNIPHLFRSSPSSEVSHMITLFFLKDSFGPDFFENQEMDEIRPIFNCFNKGFMVSNTDGFIETLFNGLEPENKFELFMNLLKLLDYLTKAEKNFLVEEEYTAKISSQQGQRLQQVFDYTIQNFENEIQLNEVAQKIHMSKNAFCRFFKQRTNKTYFEFLAEIRIHHACELLKEQQDLPIGQIAMQSGYNTISNFNRQFREIKGLSPRAYRG